MKQTPKTTQVNSKIIIAVAIMILAVLSLVIQFLIQTKSKSQPDVFVGEAASPSFSSSSNPAASTLAANASTVVTMKMSSTAGKAQTIAAKISWDPAKYTFDQTYGLRQASHGFNPVQTINTSEGFASVAYIPMVQGGDITVVSGNIDLFSIKLISKVSNPSMPVGTGQIEYVGDINPSEQQACAAAGGTWREFSDGCADLCNRGSACTQAFTTSCDCPNGCWDATSKTCKTSDACSNVTCGTGQGCVNGSCVNSVPRCSANIYISKGEYEYRDTVVGAAPLSAYIYVGGGVDGTGGIQGYQVDFEGDGTWDTDYFDPSPNGYITHTYTQTGTFTPKYRILTTLGSVSGACSYVNSIQVTSSTDPDPSHGLNIKTTLYKVSKPGVSIQAVVDVLPSGGNTPLQTKTITFESDANGVFRSGTVTSGTFTAGPIVFDLGNYTGDLAIRIKGPKHLRRRVNSIPGTNTNIDLTAYPLMPGDLPWNQGAQDGLANEYDLSAILNNITSLTAPEAARLNIADVNYDGVVNLLDYSIVREVLLSRPDDN